MPPGNSELFQYWIEFCSASLAGKINSTLWARQAPMALRMWQGLRVNLHYRIIKPHSQRHPSRMHHRQINLPQPFHAALRIDTRVDHVIHYRHWLSYFNSPILKACMPFLSRCIMFQKISPSGFTLTITRMSALEPEKTLMSRSRTDPSS